MNSKVQMLLRQSTLTEEQQLEFSKFLEGLEAIELQALSDLFEEVPASIEILYTNYKEKSSGNIDADKLLFKEYFLMSSLADSAPKSGGSKV